MVDCNRMAESVHVLAKALDILELLAGAEQPMTSREISHDIRLPTSTVHRLLNTLVSRGYVRKDERSHTYAIGLKLLKPKERTLHEANLSQLAQPVLRTLAAETGWTAHLAILIPDALTYLDQWINSGGISLRTRLGEIAPLYCTAVGKALLAWLPDDQLTGMISRFKFERRTATTITDAHALREELARVRRQGYAEDASESDSSLHCFGAPLRDGTGTVVAAISITTFADQLDDVKYRTYVQTITRRAAEISLLLGDNPQRH
jgi:DNA-binding IclR family transcriptional regulator